MSGNYCPHCMKPATGPRCPHCGGDMSWRGQKGIDLPVGTVLTGGNGLRTYQLGAARGKGGFGITYVALEVNSGRRMAVKEYFPTRCAVRAGNEVDVQTMSGQEDVFRAGMNSFLDEGKMLLSQDDLPCVVHVIDYFQANGTAYLVMEYLDGVALHTQMAKMGGRIPVNELMPRLAPLLRDIGQLHQRGVIHRDISPDNIMWMPNGTLKLLDFGSARSMENGKSMTVLMKHGFSPIEQYRSKGQGPYTDIYALAATIYYCVTGVIPPAAVDRLEDDALQPPAALGAALTVDQETALLWALSLQPSARPQSMEEFASRLYKGSPAPGPQDPVQPAYGNPAPAGQNPAYRYSYNNPAAGQYGGQSQYGPTAGPYGPATGQQGPTVGQYGPATGQQGPTTGQYGPATGRYGPATGPYGGQGQTGGQAGGSGGNKKLPVIIGGVAAAVVILIAAAVIILNNNNNSTAADPTHTIAPSPTQTVAPATPTPDIRTGVTDDGFLYEVVDQDNVTLTGYEGNGLVYDLPSYVKGSPVTSIADSAFAGAFTAEYVLLPSELKTIGANAFRGCSGLEYVVAYSDVTTDAASFNGCGSLWFVCSYDENVSGWNLPGGVDLFYIGMETGAGTLEEFSDGLYEGMMGGWTEDGNVVLLGVRPGSAALDLDDVDWICFWALDNLSHGASILLGEETLFSFEVYDVLNDWSAPADSLADMWLLTCQAAYSINDARPADAPRIAPDMELLQAAAVRAEELSELYDGNERPNGKKWSTVVSEREIDWSFLGGTAGYRSDWEKVHSELPEYIATQRAAALTAEQSEELAGRYFTTIGAAYYYASDEGRYYFQSLLVLN